MSGGQQQRVAIARAVAAKAARSSWRTSRPAIWTPPRASTLCAKLTALNEREGTSIILITHDNKLAQMAKRIVTIQDGRIVSDRASEGEDELDSDRSHGSQIHTQQQDPLAADHARHHHRRRVRHRHRRVHPGARPSCKSLQYEAMGANRIDVYAWGARNKDWQEFEEYLDSLDEVDAWSPQSQYWDWQNGGVQYRSKKNGLERLGQRLSSDVFRQRTLRRGYEHVLCGARPDEADCKSRARYV